jgi:eukaryotic-like serine/threonine-protein kinase
MDTEAQLRTALADRYAVEREIGAGGMATVYLARDLKHDRKVALKVLKAELGAVLGVERFLAEIKVTANLQHPNLLPLFDSGEANGLLFYVMPFIEGESLRERLRREKQLPIDEALRLTEAVAAALDYAHRHGVIHRDLKPENILLQDGQPLVADFGIALAVSNAGGNRITQTGLSLGTPQYMSPEQATGDRAIDGRTDIYSLGAILYEMLTGDPPYIGSTAQAIIARVLTESPRSVRAQRQTIPEFVDHAVARALAKLPADRFASAHEFASALHGQAVSGRASELTVFRTADVARNRRWTTFVPWAVAIVALALGTVAAVGSRLWSRSPQAVVVSTILPPPGEEFSEQESMGALSPDGKQLAFVTLGLRGETQLWIRRLDTLGAHVIPGTAGAAAPFWSPDGKSIGYFSQSALFIASVTGGVTRQLCSLPTPYAGSWGTGDVIAIASDSGILRAGPSGGCKIAIKRDTIGFGPRHVWLLPDSRHVLFTNQGTAFAIFAGDLDAGTKHILLDQIVDPSYVAPGILLFGQEGAEGKARVWARRFDARHLSFTGSAVPLTEAVRTAGGVFAYAASDGPALAYLPGRGDNGEIIVDRAGRVVDTLRIDGAWMHRWARSHPWIVAEAEPATLIRVDVDRHTQSVLRRSGGISPVWSPGDSLLASGHCGPDRRLCGVVVTRLADGHDSLLVDIPSRWTAWPSSWSNDGRYLVYTRTAGFAQLGGDTWVYDFKEHSSARAVGLDDGVLEASLSPDARWIAYRSIETGTWEVYVRPFQRAGAAVRISATGGRLPQWNANGRELFYQAPDGNVMSSDVQTGGTQFVFSAPRALVMAPAWSRHTFYDIGTSYDVRPDGQRFAFRMSATGSDLTGTAIVLVQNWRALLER